MRAKVLSFDINCFIYFFVTVNIKRAHILVFFAALEATRQALRNVGIVNQVQGEIFKV